MPASVFLADLRHNYAGVVSVDAMPLGIGFMKAVMDRDLPGVESRLFAYPDRLWDALREQPPDVLLLSNYVWNESLGCHFARLAKRVRPQTLVVMGGPNMSLEPERKLAFLRAHPAIDLYVLGEGDFLATEIVRRFLEAGHSIERLGEQEIPSCIYRRPGGELVAQPAQERHKEVDEIPSAYLGGTMDPFFDGKLAPMIETNRGCPFTCTFCVQGTRFYTKVHHFSVERVRAELDYIAERIRTLSPTMGSLVIADPNYGMFERDAAISAHIGGIQDRWGWPTFISASTGKNRPDRIIQSLELVHKAMSFRQALQSTNPNTLVQIKRDNISQDAYGQVMRHVQGRGLRSVSDLILGLPGETLQSHVDAIHGLVDARTDELHNFQAMLLKGTELETQAAREKYRFESRFRVLPKEFGVYAGEKVFDMDEVVVATDTLSFDDYVTARRYAFAFSVFLNNSWFEDPMAFAESFGIARSAVMDAMLHALEDDRGEARALLDAFVDETLHELFPTREACIEFYSREESFRRLADGEVGDNLIYKYRSIASFFAWPEVCRVALEAIRGLLVERGADARTPGFAELWADLHRFTECKHAAGKTIEEILSPVRARLRHRIGDWLAAGMPEDASGFRWEEPRDVEFFLPDDRRRELDAALRVWSTSVKGLTKGVTRIRARSQVREWRTLEASSGAEPLRASA